MGRRKNSARPLPWWADSPPRVLLILDQPTEVYTIGAFANVVGRTAITVRRWVRLGLVPETPFKDTWGVRQRHRRFWPGDLLWEVAHVAQAFDIPAGSLPDDAFYSALETLYERAVAALVTRQQQEVAEHPRASCA